jgi:MacB-like periplasmic core domain
VKGDIVFGWFRRKRIREREIEEELDHHVAMLARERVEKGEALDQANSAAYRTLGNKTLIKESLRGMWGWSSLERLKQDLRYAFRTLRRSPVIAAVAILSLALGIGVNTAIFSLIDSLMLKALPVKNSNQLILLGDGVTSGSTDDEPFGTWKLFSYPVYKELRSHNRVFSDMLAFLSNSDPMFVDIDRDESERARPALVSGNYFSVLGVPALIGRTLTPADETPGANPVAVLSYSYWDRRFVRDPGVHWKIHYCSHEYQKRTSNSSCRCRSAWFLRRKDRRLT